MLTRLWRYFRRKKYRRGALLMRFVAPDIRRDVEIVDDAEVDAGFVYARIRTWNVLYAFKLGQPPEEPTEARRVAIRDLWTWTGRPTGGPVPDDDVSRKSGGTA